MMSKELKCIHCTVTTYKPQICLIFGIFFITVHLSVESSENTVYYVINNKLLD